jgi:hypothetical protein
LPETMSTPVKDRLREASLALSDDSSEALAAAAARLGSLRIGLDEILARVRLAHGLPEGEVGHKAVVDQINREQLLVDVETDDQMISLLCSMGLVATFAEADPSRSAATVRRQTIAALAVRTLARAGIDPAHPDLRSWASHWLVTQARSMREYRRSQPPRPEEVPEDAERAALDTVVLDLKNLREAAGETAEWLERLAGVGSIEAMREQLQIFWWLNSAPRTGEANEVAIGTALELATVSLVPPPPAAGEVIARRLASFRNVAVDPSEFEEVRGSNGLLGDVAKRVPDLTPLLASGLPRPLDVAALAHAVYEEILLAGLIENEQRAIRVRREAQERARRAAANVVEQPEGEGAEQ